jgi:hypothetical protein
MTYVLRTFESKLNEYFWPTLKIQPINLYTAPSAICISW